MPLRKKLSIAVVCCALLAAGFAQAPPAKDSALPIFPQSFAGWGRGTVQAGIDAAVVDPSQGGVLREYGFTDFEKADYAKDGRTLKLKAARFKTATGAYGAFTFYRELTMKPERIGTVAASANERVLFFRDNILIEASFDHTTAMSASELRELAGVLPVVTGADSKLPPLPEYLPQSDYALAHSARFIVGPLAYEALHVPVPIQLINFNVSPEILVQKLSTSEGSSDLVLVSYPTPQIAIDRTAAFVAANPHQPNTTWEVKRSGPIVALAIGPIAASDAKAMLGLVNYEAQATWTETTGMHPRDNIGSLVVGALMLAIIIFIMSVGSGVVFGFARSMLNRAFPGRFLPHTEETDFIRLDLK